MLYKDELCFHCKSVLSGLTEDQVLAGYIGKIQSMDTDMYLAYCKELTYLISLRFQGFRTKTLDPMEFKHISFKTNDKHVCYNDIDGRLFMPKYVPKDRVLSELLALDATSCDTHFKWASMMKIKTAVPPNRNGISKKDLKDHLESITDDFKGNEEFVSALETLVRKTTRLLIEHSGVSMVDREVYIPITHHPALDKSFTTIKSDGRSVVTRPRNTLEPFNLKGILRLPEIQELYCLDPDSFVSRAFVGTRVRNASFDLKEYPLVGKGTPLSVIGFIPNAGGKWRVVAVPNPLLQSLSYPIGQVAKKINSSWKVQGVDSHKNTCNTISSLLTKFNGRKTFYSIDMSNWTDRMPYRGLIRVVVDELVRNQVLSPFDLAVMDLVSEGSILIDNQIRRYGVGTPMGTYPSFPLASLANGVAATIAYAWSHELDLSKINLDRVPARIIGDDIVIWDDKTAYYYELIMGECGLEVQPSKCITSPFVAEMCSKMITHQGVFQQKRIDSLATAEDVQSFVEQVRYYGSDALLEIRPELTDLIQLLAKVPEPLGLAPGLSDQIYWSDHPIEYSLFKAIQDGNDFKITDNIRLDALDYEIIYRRKQLLPKSLTYEVVETYDYYQCNPLVQSLQMDLWADIAIIRSREESSLEEKEDASIRLQSLLTAFKEFYHWKDKDQMPLPSEDYHLHPPVYHIQTEESGLNYSKAYNDLIESVRSIIPQEKEDPIDDREF